MRKMWQKWKQGSVVYFPYKEEGVFHFVFCDFLLELHLLLNGKEF